MSIDSPQRVRQAADLKRSIRNSAWTFSLIALAFYVGFIVMSLVRGSH